MQILFLIMHLKTKILSNDIIYFSNNKTMTSVYLLLPYRTSLALYTMCNEFRFKHSKHPLCVCTIRHNNFKSLNYVYR